MVRSGQGVGQGYTPPDELWAWKVAAQLAVATPGDFPHWVHWPAVPTG